MVVSLALVLALIGSGAGLLIGIFAFSEVSDTLECPASSGSTLISVTNVTSYDNLGTLGSAEDAVYAESEVIVDFLPSVTGKINEAVVQEGVASGGGALNGEIYLGSTPSDWWFLSGQATGSDEISISFWLKGDVVGSNEYHLLSNFAPVGQTDGLFIETESGRLRPIIEDDNSQKISAFMSPTPSEPPDDGQWHLLTFTYDKSITTGNANFRYCLDGTSDLGNGGVVEGCRGDATANNGGTKNDWTGNNNPPIDFLTIGSDGDHNSGGSNIEDTFMVDDLAIWNGYILSDTDIDNMWNSGSGASVSSLGISPSTRVAYYSFDDTTANGVVTTTGSGGSDGTGSEQCQSAKDIAWSVIGIMPVALFFGLFTLFNFVIPKS